MTLPGRPYWRGFLRLSLVSIPVALYNAVESKSGIHFNQIHKPTGKRIRYEKTVQGGGKAKNDEIVKGYEVAEDQYVILEPAEIEAIKLESRRTIDLLQFVDKQDIDPRFYERPYCLVPQDEDAREGYLVIREALKKADKVGLAQLTINGREWLVAIAPLEKGLSMELIRYADELRAPKAFFDDIPERKLDREMIDLASQLIEKKSAPFRPEVFKDSYEEALRSLIEEKAKGHRIAAPPAEAEPSKVIDIMSALRRSLEQQKPAKAEKKPSQPKPAPRGREKAG